MPANDERMLLIGGCDLLQTATYLSANRFEYVNRNNRGEVARYDDPGFVLSSREAISASEALPQLTSWTKEDVLRFDADLGNSDTIVVSFSHALSGEYLELPDGVMVRIPYARVARDTLPSGAHYLQLCLAQKLEWIARSFDRIAELSPAAERRFVLGANTRGGDNSHFEDQKAYNRMASRYCERRGGYEFVSVDEIVPESELLDAFHFTRKGYFALARELRRRIDRSVEAEAFLFSASPPPQGFLAQSVDPTLSAFGALIAE